MEVFPLPNHTASTVAKVLVFQIISRFGVPLEIHSIQGCETKSLKCEKD